MLDANGTMARFFCGKQENDAAMWTVYSSVV